MIEVDVGAGIVQILVESVGRSETVSIGAGNLSLAINDAPINVNLSNQGAHGIPGSGGGGSGYFPGGW